MNNTQDNLLSPFPWFGGKSSVADQVWGALGKVQTYIEPFFGSGAVLLNRGSPIQGTEIINDLDGFVVNFWRATQQDPEGVASFVLSPINEIDLLARHRWLCETTRKREFLKRMQEDPEYYDVKVAGWWVWGISAWIGSGWCTRSWNPAENKDVSNALPSIDGIRGIHRKGHGFTKHNEDPMDRSNVRGYLQALAIRLRYISVCCGDWSRVLLKPKPGNTKTGVFLDPPYSEGIDSDRIYPAGLKSVIESVGSWALDNGSNPNLRIVLCGYEGQYPNLLGWRILPWKARGGYGNQGEENPNCQRERLWLSPGCLEEEPSILDILGDAD